MGIFGRNTARQRLRRATRESLTIPAFSSPIDCTPWVIGGLWPAELSPVTAENARAAEHLKVDLQRIVDSANEELKAVRRAAVPHSARQAAEARVITSARAFALRRVESTVRHLHAGGPDLSAQDRRVEATEVGEATAEPLGKDPGNPEGGRHAAKTVGQHDGSPHELIEPADVTESAVEPDDVDQASTFDPDRAELADAGSEELTVKSHGNADIQSESSSERLWRLLQFVARQEPGLRWAVGDREDGTTVLVTDLAHGWIPSGINLPAGVRLLKPDRRSGNAAALLGSTTLSATYAPGDPLGWAMNSKTEASLDPRELPEVADLGWLLSEATHWRDGLPRMVNTLARAAGAGTGVLEAEIDVLRVHLDTARYQVLAQYPDVDVALLLNTFLLAATEGIATGDLLSANYHFCWFQKLSAPPASKWVS